MVILLPIARRWADFAGSAQSNDKSADECGNESVEKHGEDGFSKDGTFLIREIQDGRDGHDVVDRDHVSHCGTDGLQCKDCGLIQMEFLGNALLDGAEGEVRDGGGAFYYLCGK